MRMLRKLLMSRNAILIRQICHRAALQLTAQESLLWVRTSGLLLISLMPLGCIMGSHQDSSRIVEKSRPTAPSWTESTAAELTRQGQQWIFIWRKDNSLDLPLALQETQSEALKLSRERLFTHLHDLLVVKYEPDLTPQEQVELNSLLEDATVGIHGSEARIADLYFEGLIGDADQKHYRVYVLLTISDSVFGQVRQQIATKLARSKHYNLRKLIGEIGQEPVAQPFGH